MNLFEIILLNYEVFGAMTAAWMIVLTQYDEVHGLIAAENKLTPSEWFWAGVLTGIFWPVAIGFIIDGTHETHQKMRERTERELDEFDRKLTERRSI